MKNEIDGAYIAAEVRLLRQTQKGTILIVEGNTDALVFENFIDYDKCDIEIGFGKKNVIDALDRLEDEGFPGVVALIDADFDRLLGKQYGLENIVLTDKHDLDLTIFSSSAFDKYIYEHADRDLCKKEFSGDVSAIRERVLKASMPLAYCRFLSETLGLNLYFKNLKHEEFINEDDLSPKCNELISELINRSSKSCSEASLKGYIASEAKKAYDPYQLANGHDVAAILGIALRKLIGNRRDVQTWASEIESGLRLAFDWEKMMRTQVFQRLRHWETENKRYRIFRDHVV